MYKVQSDNRERNKKTASTKEVSSALISATAMMILLSS